MVHQRSIGLATEGERLALIGSDAPADPGAVGGNQFFTLINPCIKPIERTGNIPQMGRGQIFSMQIPTDGPVTLSLVVLGPGAAFDMRKPVAIVIVNVTGTEYSSTPDVCAP